MTNLIGIIGACFTGCGLTFGIIFPHWIWLSVMGLALCGLYFYIKKGEH